MFKNSLRLATAVTLFGLTPLSAKNRTIDGSRNAFDDLGTAGQPFLRLTPAAYGDGLNTLAGASRSNPRTISNAVARQTGARPNQRQGSDYIWQWGQFIDHDLTLSEPNEEEPAVIRVPFGDPLFPIIPLNRTKSEQDVFGVRQQINSITPFLDASMVYGSDDERARALRSFRGGRLRVDVENMMPFNDTDLHMDVMGPVPQTLLRLSGDVRANEQPGLTALHTIFVREHNRWADELRAENPRWSDENLYQAARKRVGALVQSITYNEWLPALIGSYAPDVDALRYDQRVDPRVSNEFATAFFRLGHTMVSPQLMRIRNDDFCDDVPLSRLRDIFFRPGTMEDGPTMELILKGMANQLHEDVDTGVTEELRDFLFGQPGMGGLDLAALNIQRGRDHGLGDYNSTREFFGLECLHDWDRVTDDSDLAQALSAVYPDMTNVDLWVGALSEDPSGDSSLGELLSVSLASEFRRLAMADRFFYRWDFALTDAEVNEIEATTLADVIQRNTNLTSLQDNIFFIPRVEETPSLKMARSGAEMEFTFYNEPGEDIRLMESPDLKSWMPMDLEDADGQLTARFRRSVAMEGPLADQWFFQVVRAE